MDQRPNGQKTYWTQDLMGKRPNGQKTYLIDKRPMNKIHNTQKT